MNWNAVVKVVREVVLLVCTGAGPTLTLTAQLHPTWTWVGPAQQVVAWLLSAGGYVATRNWPSLKQEAVIAEQQHLIDSLRPPAPEKTK